MQTVLPLVIWFLMMSPLATALIADVSEGV